MIHLALQITTKRIKRHHRPYTDHSQIENRDFELAIPDFEPTIRNYELARPKRDPQNQTAGRNSRLIQVATHRKSQLVSSKRAAAT